MSIKTLVKAPTDTIVDRTMQWRNTHKATGRPRAHYSRVLHRLASFWNRVVHGAARSFARTYIAWDM